MHGNWAACGGLLALTVFMAPAMAGEWRLNPAIDVQEAWTDNARSTSTDRKSDFITTVNPSLRLDGEGAGVKAALEYGFAYDLYAASNDLSGWRHDGLGVVDADVIPDLFSIGARGAIAEQTLNPVGVQTAGDRTAAANRTRVATYSVTPQLYHRFNSWGIGRALYRHDETLYLSEDVGINPTTQPADSIGDTGRVELRSGEDFGRLLWRYGLDTTRVDRSGEIFTGTANRVDGEYKLVSQFGLLAHVGYDVLNDTYLDSDRFGGVFYGGGAHLALSPDTDLRAEVGKRYDGVDVNVLARYRIGPKTSINLAHDPQVTPEGSILAGALDDVQRDESGHFIDPFSGLKADPTMSPLGRSSSLFKLRSTEAAFNYGGSRSSVTLTAGLTSRKDLARAPGTESANGHAFTIGLAAQHELSERLRVVLRLAHDNITDTATPGGDGMQDRIAVDLLYEVTPTLIARIGYRYVDMQPDQGAGMTENMVIMGVRKTF